MTAALSPERIARLCVGECYFPSDRRRAITRIEIVRIRSGGAPDGAEDRIEDPWRVLPCPAGASACTVEVEDETFGSLEGDVAYYARAIQEPTLAVNGGGLRCETDGRGGCLRVRPCYGDDRTPLDDDCLSEVEERAWSSPIFISEEP